MFKIGDVVLYGIQGICKISGIEVKQIGRNAFDYYVLNPVFNENTALFVPVDNENLTSKMQKILTKTQVKQLIEKIGQIGVLEICDEATKREQYREILSSNNREKLVSLIKAIRIEREERSKCNKKLNMSDEQTLYKAERLLFNEIAFVLECDPQEVQKIIKF